MQRQLSVIQDSSIHTYRDALKNSPAKLCRAEVPRSADMPQSECISSEEAECERFPHRMHAGYMWTNFECLRPQTREQRDTRHSVSALASVNEASVAHRTECALQQVLREEIGHSPADSAESGR